MKNVLKTFEPNELGRDFVIGDLHGSLSCFENLCKHIKFDPEKDRMFSVGDLVDRGPDSLGTLRLLRQPWFHCVLSNHEQMMLEAFNGGYMGQYWFMNGGNWGLDAWYAARSLQKSKNGTLESAPVLSDADMELIDLLCLVEELPFLITLTHKNGKKFHIIHAELPPGFLVSDSELTDSEKVLELATQQTSDGDCFVWGRFQFYPFYKTDLSNREKLIRAVKYNDGAAPYSDQLSHIISGHTIVQHPITLVGQTNIDTGAYNSYPHVAPRAETKAPRWAALTCICLDDWTFMQATATQFRTCEPFVINKSDLT